MAWTVPGGRIFGIPIRLHLFLLVFFLTETVTTCRWFGWDGLWIGAIQWVLIYVFVLAHELGHCFAGEHQGGEAEEILLWPLGGLAMIGGVPQRPGPQIITNIAGPAVNLVVCLIVGTVLVLGDKSEVIFGALPIFGAGLPWPQTYGIWWYLVAYIFGINLLNMLFNLIPAWPLDGGKVLVWSLTPRLGYGRAAMLGTTVGFVFAVILGITGLILFLPMLILLAIFVWVFCRWERARIQAEAIGGIEGDIFGYDFSHGYTSLESSGPDAGPARKRRERKPGPLRRWLDKRAARRREQEMSEELAVRRKVDELLDKISQAGMDALSDGERRFLKDASKRYGD